MSTAYSRVERAAGLGKVEPRAVAGPADERRLPVVAAQAVCGSGRPLPEQLAACSCRPSAADLSLTTKATERPSGENIGENSAPPVVASGRMLSVATSTIDTSEVGQSSASGVLRCAKTIDLPSGDQSKLPPPGRSGSTDGEVTGRQQPWLGCVLAAGLTRSGQGEDIEPLHLRIAIDPPPSSFAFDCASSSFVDGSAITKAI